MNITGGILGVGNRSGSTNGTVIPIDGGRHAQC